MSQPLDILTFPLRGTHLIEASAGTGKTYTLAALYVRLILGHGNDNSFGRPLLPPDILVVTFTEAATKELRDRIRQRLSAAARLFADTSGAEADSDAFLISLRNSVPESERPMQAARLRAAAQWMDDAAIYTIHSFCQRMLRQHAFDSGSLFTLELTPDEEQLLCTATEDYWRTFCLNLDGHQASWLAHEFSTPAHLLTAIRPLLNNSESLAHSGDDFNTILDHWIAEYDASVSELKQRWGAWSQELLALFEDAWASGRLPKSKPSRSASVRGWLNKLNDWCNDTEDTDKPKAITQRAVEALSHAQLSVAADDIDELLGHPAIDQFSELEKVRESWPRLAPRLLPHACRWIAERLAHSKHQQALVGFDDMLRHLHAALNDPQGSVLADQIRRQYPFALIDEFQDTDPIQYGIFDKIYGDTHSRDKTDTGWLMIGDPKQAIYSFRGADIYTYLEARHSTQGNHHTLTTNYRSDARLVSAINAVFERAQHNPKGAFLLGDDIPFQPVQASGRGEKFVINGEHMAPLTLWHLQKDPGDKDQSFDKGSYRKSMANACAASIANLLGLARSGQAGFEDQSGMTPVALADIAILVRDRREAEAMRVALQRFNLPSVYLSDRDNVFATAEARDLLTWMRACAEPGSEALTRLALASATLQQDWQQLHQLVSDETLWEDTAHRFVTYHRLWQQRGILTVIRQLLKDFDVAAHLLATSEGERQLTNVLHLGELLQQQASVVDGEQALVRWLAEMIDAAHGGSSNTAEEQILRLESDAGLIKIITQHKSKGLEYPLVYIPFACAFRPVSADRPPVRYHDNLGKLTISLAPDSQAIRQADQERLAEDLRLMYVAMTRARHACWIGIAATRSGRQYNACELHRSAIGHLLGASSDTRAEDVTALLETVDHPDISVTEASRPEDARPVSNTITSTLTPARQATRRKDGHWWIASYSALSKSDAHEAPDDIKADILREASRESRGVSLPADDSIHGFPRGALPGTFLHELLEWGAEHGFNRMTASDEEWQHTLTNRCESHRWEKWQPTLSHWLQSLVSTPLMQASASLSLAGLQKGNYQAEMEFWLPVNQVDVSSLDKLVCQHTLDGVPRPPLSAPELNGMLKGFIDLVMMHDNQFFVVDYKSNWLGDDNDSYHPSALQNAIVEGRYDMQYCLYLLALHRLLRARLGDRYDYDTHMGGSLYLFLRGVDHDSHGVFSERPDRSLIEAMDQLFREGGQ